MLTWAQNGCWLATSHGGTDAGIVTSSGCICHAKFTARIWRTAETYHATSLEDAQRWVAQRLGVAPTMKLTVGADILAAQAMSYGYRRLGWEAPDPRLAFVAFAAARKKLAEADEVMEALRTERRTRLPMVEVELEHTEESEARVG